MQTQKSIQYRKMKKTIFTKFDFVKIFKKNIALNLLFAFVGFVALNFISSKLFFRIDATEENLYTLSDGTKSIIKEIDELTTIKFFFSQANKDIPQTYRQYAKRIEEILKEYTLLNPQNLVLEILDPKPDSDEEQAAKGYNLAEADIGSAYKFFLGLAILQGDNQETLRFFDLRTESSLEYDITQRIYKIQNNKKMNLAIMDEIGVGGNPFQPNTSWAFYNELSKFYNVEIISKEEWEIDDNIDILLVFHPKSLVSNPTKEEQSRALATEYAIDQFLLKKGKLIVVVDSFARIDTQNVAGRPPVISASDLPTLFRHWEIDYKVENVIADLENPHILRSGIQTAPYPLWHDIEGEALLKTIPALENLESILIPEPGGFIFSKSEANKNLTFRPLLSTSNTTGVFFSQLLPRSNPTTVANSLQRMDKQYHLIALLNGKFTSAFQQRPSFSNLELGENFKNPHLKNSKKDARALLISDADWMSDPFSVQKFQALGQTIVQPVNDNLGLFLNLVDYFSGSDKLFAIRSRGKFSRPFDKINDLEKEAQNNYQQVEQQLKNELIQIQQQLDQLQPQTGSNEIILDKEQIQKIKKFQEREKNTRIELREIRKLLRQDIELLESTLKTINLIIVPSLVLFLGLFVFYKRYRKKQTK